MPDFTNLTGCCLCESVSYNISSEPLALYLCHCMDCQKRSGSAFAMAMFIRANALEILRGDTLAKLKIKEGKTASIQHYCPDCLVRLYTEFPHRPNLISIRPGTLDDTSWVKPNLQLWTKRAKLWLQNLPLKAFEEETDDLKAFVWSYHDSL